MVELENKYQIGVRRFGLINWVGAYSLYKKEVLRFIIVSGQTLLGPILTSISVSYTHLTLPTNREV